MLGCGSVGSPGGAAARTSRPATSAARVGAPVELAGVAVRRLDAPREVEVPEGLLTTDADGLVARDDVDLVIEVIGGIEPARSLILAALEHGASRRHRQQGAARRGRPDPLRGRREGRPRPLLRGRRRRRDPDPAAAARVAGRRPGTRVLGIVNGTTNFILDKMDTSGAGFAEALEEAQELGYAEADPTADVEGFDAAAKAAILASLAFHSRVTAADVHREGITEVTAADVAVGPRDGQRRQAARHRRAARDGAGVAVRVHPAMIPRSPPAGRGARGVQRGLRRVRGRRPADVLRPRRRRCADRVSAVLGDLVTVARNRLAGTRGAGESAYADRGVLPMGETVTRYHVAIDVDDRAGVLAAVATAFAEHGVSIQTVRQEGRGDGRPARRGLATGRPTRSSRRPSTRCATWTSSARSPR